MKKVLVITGASKGIGKATALYFHEHGWSVINLSRNPCEIEAVDNFKVDLLKTGWQEKIADLTEKIKDADKICLVHNAAAYYSDSIQDLPEQHLRNTLELNVVVPSMLNQLIIPYLKPSSAIIYIGSTLSTKAVKSAASYIISKHAVAGMMSATCQDLVGSSVHTACICPGFTDTEMLRQHIGEDEKMLAWTKSKSCADRLLQPEEIAATVWFAANNPAINGVVLHANLGQVES